MRRDTFFLSVETGEWKGDTAGLDQRNNPPPVEVEQIVQLHQVAGNGYEWRGNHAAMHQVQHRQQQDRLVRGLVFGGFGPDRAGGAIEVGELFYGSVEIGPVFKDRDLHGIDTLPYVYAFKIQSIIEEKINRPLFVHNANRKDAPPAPAKQLSFATLLALPFIIPYVMISSGLFTSFRKAPAKGL